MDEYGEIYENEDLDPIGSNMFINVGESSDEECEEYGTFGTHKVDQFGICKSANDMKRMKSHIKKRETVIHKEVHSSTLHKYRFAFSSHEKDSASDSTHSFTIDLTEHHIGTIKNIVGFNILRASIPITHHPINSSNNEMMLIGGATLKAKLTAAGYSTTGYFDVYELGSATGATYDTNTKKYTFTSEITWVAGAATSILAKQIAKIFGIIAGTTYASSAEATNIIDIRGSGFIDIEIKEINALCCIHSSHSSHIVARVPIIVEHGTTQEYHARTIDLNTRHARSHADLHKLTVQLLDEHGTSLDLNGANIHLVCEVTVIGNVHYEDKIASTPSLTQEQLQTASGYE